MLAGGITYAAFFSLFPALAAGFSVFGLIARQRPGAAGSVVEAVNEAFGTPIVKLTESDEGVVLLSSLIDGSALSIAGIIALAGLLLHRARLARRDARGDPRDVRPGAGRGQHRDRRRRATSSSSSAFGLVILASAGTGVVVNSATGALLGAVGLSEPSSPARSCSGC